MFAGDVVLDSRLEASLEHLPVNRVASFTRSRLLLEGKRIVSSLGSKALFIAIPDIQTRENAFQIVSSKRSSPEEVVQFGKRQTRHYRHAWNISVRRVYPSHQPLKRAPQSVFVSRSRAAFSPN